MPSINFKPEFAEAVKNGTKRQTIRQIRKNPIKPGDMLTMFTGQRTKECRKLCMHKCKSVEEIEIYTEKLDAPPPISFKMIDIPVPAELAAKFDENAGPDNTERYGLKVIIRGNSLEPEEVLELAQADGFEWELPFAAFFNSHYGDNFKGVLIKW